MHETYTSPLADPQLQTRDVNYVDHIHCWEMKIREVHVEYLEHANARQRRLWTKLRGGCLELRVETGRWERMSVGGQQVAVPRHLRYCKMCFREVEDSAHVFFRCPAYRTQRDALAEQVCKLATPGRCAEGNGWGEKKEKRRRKAGGRGMCDAIR